MVQEGNGKSADWAINGACRLHPNPELWFVKTGESTEAARAICEHCIVRLDCLEYALTTPNASASGEG